MGLTSADLDMRDKHPRFKAVEEPATSAKEILDAVTRIGEIMDQKSNVSFDPERNLRLRQECLNQYNQIQERFASGSVRDSRVGKGRYDLLPPDAMRRLAKRFEEGAITYAPRNWEKGQPMSRYLDSGIRHAMNYLAGMRDEDHLAAAAWNFMAAMQTEEWIKSGRLPKELGDI